MTCHGPASGRRRGRGGELLKAVHATFDDVDGPSWFGLLCGLSEVLLACVMVPVEPLAFPYLELGDGGRPCAFPGPDLRFGAVLTWPVRLDLAALVGQVRGDGERCPRPRRNSRNRRDGRWDFAHRWG
jgi:hypothetical protein